MGHTDVVNVGPVTWKHSLFGAVRNGGYIYGRAPVDDKDGLGWHVRRRHRRELVALPQRGRWRNEPADPARKNHRSAIDAEGFGGYTALFSTVVSQHNFWVNYGKGQPDEARFTRLLLDRGADPNVRASIRQRLEQGHGGGPLREYRDVTPLVWGEQFAAKIFVSRESMRLVEARGGGR